MSVRNFRLYKCMVKHVRFSLFNGVLFLIIAQLNFQNTKYQIKNLIYIFNFIFDITSFWCNFSSRLEPMIYVVIEGLSPLHHKHLGPML